MRPPGAADPPATEAALVGRVLDALLREDHLGIARAGDLGSAPFGSHPMWWHAPLPDGPRGARALALPVVPDGFLAPYRTAQPLLVVLDGGAADGDGVRVERSIEGVLAALAPGQADAEAVAGWAAFAQECRESRAVVARHAAIEPALLAATATTRAVGLAGLVARDALAAVRDHPVHPTGRCRLGLTADEERRWAPEHRPRFALRWTDVALSDLTTSPSFRDDLPAWWPAAPEGRVALPVHPLTVERGLAPVRTEVGSVEVVPTLSMRTVAVVHDPGVHLKLPLPIATLGIRNRRTIKPGTLADGARVHRLLGAVLDREPRLAATVLPADESCWAACNDHLAVLVRRWPPGLDGDDLVPVAALAAPDPHGSGTLLDRLARGDVAGWFDGYLTTLLDWHVALLLRYGVALEAHQQNVAVAQRGPNGPRLLYKDDDSPRIDPGRLGAALDTAVPAFADARIATADPHELTDMLVTITLHLCAAAPLMAASADDAALRRRLFALLRDRLTDAVDRWHDPADPGSRRAVDVLRRCVLDAEALPVKGMVTAGTLLPKQRLGCTDVNTHYLRTGPNYLRWPPASARGSAVLTSVGARP